MTEEPVSQGTESVRERRRRAGLRGAVAVLLIVGMTYGWLQMAQQKGRRQFEAVEAVEGLGGLVYLDYQWIDGAYDEDASPPQVAWLRTLLGGEVLDRAVAVDLRAVDQIEEAVHWLRLMPFVREIDATGAPLTDSSLVSCKRLKGLERLKLDQTLVSDAGLESLVSLPRLGSLSLVDTSVSDDGLDVLTGCRLLRHLDLTGTETSPPGVDRLRAALSKCEVIQ